MEDGSTVSGLYADDTPVTVVLLRSNSEIVRSVREVERDFWQQERTDYV